MRREQLDMPQTPQEAWYEAQLCAGAALFRAAASLDRATSQAHPPEDPEEDTLVRVDPVLVSQHYKPGPIQSVLDLVEGMHVYSRGWIVRTSTQGSTNERTLRSREGHRRPACSHAPLSQHGASTATRDLRMGFICAVRRRDSKIRHLWMVDLTSQWYTQRI